MANYKKGVCSQPLYLIILIPSQLYVSDEWKCPKGIFEKFVVAGRCPKGIFENFVGNSSFPNERKKNFSELHRLKLLKFICLKRF